MKPIHKVFFSLFIILLVMACVGLAYNLGFSAGQKFAYTGLSAQLCPSEGEILATSTIESSNVCTGMMVDEVLCGQYLRKTGYSCFNLPPPLCDKNSGISCSYQNMNAPNIGNCLTAQEGYEKDYPQQ